MANPFAPFTATLALVLALLAPVAMAAEAPKARKTTNVRPPPPAVPAYRPVYRPPASIPVEVYREPRPRLGPALLRLTPWVSSFRLDIADKTNSGTARIDSRLNAGLGVRLVPWTRDRVWAVVDLSAARLAVQAPAGTRFDTDSGAVWRALAGVQSTAMHPDLELEALAGLRRTLVVRAADGNGNLGFSRITTPELRLGASLAFAELGDWELGVSTHGGLLFAATQSSYAVEDGFTYGAELFARVETVLGELRPAVELAGQSLRTTAPASDTITSTQSRVELLFTLGLGFR